MRVLVTGAAGFMGGHLVDALVSLKKHDIFAIDDLSGGYESNVDPKAHFTKLDLRDFKKVDAYIKKVKPELIYHLAADATEGRSQFTPISATERNYLAFMYLLVPSIREGLKKIVVTSSMSVYGAQKPPFSEKMKKAPEDIYGIAKAAMEDAVEVMAKVHNFDYVIIRPHNVYGPRQNMADPYRNVIAIFINCLLNNKNFYIYGDGNQKRSFTYIDDFTPYMLKSGFSKKVNGRVINIGPTEEYSINELAKIILTVMFPKGEVPKKLLPSYVPIRPQEVKEAFCTNTVAKELLGYKTSISLNKGIESMVVWAKQLGAQKFRYLKDGLELENADMPKTWSKKLI